MTTTSGADLPLTERDVTFLIADLAGFTALTEIHGSRYAVWIISRDLTLFGPRLTRRAPGGRDGDAASSCHRRQCVP